MKKAAILGGSGYTGVELMRIIALHPEMELTAVSSRQYNGKRVDEIFSSLRGQVDLAFCEPDPKALGEGADVVFMAVPHGTAMEWAPDLIKAGVKVVDLSADFRIHSRQVYEQWYREHTCPELLPEAAYGLPEFYREDVKKAGLTANPGCYVTSVLVALVPLLKAGLLETEGIIADSASGVSGAGRKASTSFLHGEVHENFRPYAVNGHRHTPEMEQELTLAAKKEIKLTFTPHLLPMDRGILSTMYVKPAPGADQAAMHQAWQDAYQGEPFVLPLPLGILPSTMEVRGTNQVRLGLATDPRSGLIKLFSALDNLTKGASGQAVQNANLMLGLDEAQGLISLAVAP